MKNYFYKEWKVWLRTGYLPLLYFASFLLLNFLAVSSLRNLFAAPQLYYFFYHYRNMQDHTLILFAVMAFTAFELFCIYSSSDMDEYVGVYGHRTSVAAAKYLVLLPLSIVLFLVLLIYSLIGYFVVGGDFPSLLLQIISAHILNHLLPSVAACLIGGVLGMFCSRLQGYVWLTVTVYLLSPLSMQAFVAIMHTGLSVEWLQRLTSIGSPNLMTVPITVLGMPIDGQRWYLAVLWCTVPLIFLIRKLLISVPIRRIVSAVLCCLLVFSGWYSLIYGGSGMHMYEMYSSQTAESVYITSVNKIVPQQTSDAHAVSYDLTISIGSGLSASAEIQMDHIDEEYNFTLYHTFTVTSVTDVTGNPLPFEQEGDYLTVRANGHQKLKITYEGWSNFFYTNEQAVLLPAGFAFYPVSGYHRIFGNDSESISSMSPARGETADYMIRISAGIPLYSNLHYENGVYSGTSNGVTFIGGLVQETDMNGIRTVASPAITGAELSTEKLTEKLQENRSLFGNDFDPAATVDGIEAVFILPEFCPISECFVFDDHIILPESGASDSEIASAMLTNIVSLGNDKSELISVYIDIMTSYDARNQALEMLTSYEGVPRFTLDTTRIMKMTMAYERLGAENLKNTVVEYLSNGEENIDDFLSRISGWDTYWENNRLGGGDL